MGAEVPAFSVEGNADVATYLGFFDRLCTSVEGTVTSLDDLVDTESRELLGVAIGRVFSNLAHLKPDFEFATVTEPLEPRLAAELDASVWVDVEKFVQRFKRVEVEEDPAQECDDEAGAEEEGEEAIDGEDNDIPAA